MGSFQLKPQRLRPRAEPSQKRRTLPQLQTTCPHVWKMVMQMGVLFLNDQTTLWLVYVGMLQYDRHLNQSRVDAEIQPLDTVPTTWGELSGQFKPFHHGNSWMKVYQNVFINLILSTKKHKRFFSMLCFFTYRNWLRSEVTVALSGQLPMGPSGAASKTHPHSSWISCLCEASYGSPAVFVKSMQAWLFAFSHAPTSGSSSESSNRMSLFGKTTCLTFLWLSKCF